MYLIIQQFMLLKIHLLKDFKENYKDGKHFMDKEHSLVFKKEDMKINYLISEH